MTETPSSSSETTLGKVHVLGGGLAGMSCAADLAEKGVPVEVLEDQPEVGGLAESFDWDGFSCDLGPHRFHSNREEIIDHIRKPLQDNLHMRDRMSRIFMFRRFFFYPLRGSNVLRLPKLVMIKAFLDYWWMRLQLVFRDIPDDSFENYVRKRFGNTLYKIFFGTYTEKTWQIPPSQISPDWAGQRITLLNLWDVVKKTLFKPKNVPRTYVSRFHYPKTGGIGSISRGYRRIVEEHGSTVRTGTRVTGVRVEGDRIVQVTSTCDGTSRDESVETVVSTIPINRLVEMMDPLPPAEVLEAAKNLKHKAIIFVYLKLDREKVTDDHWVYLPEGHLRVHRISEFKNFSEQTCPPGKTLLCAEITCNDDDETWNQSDDELTEIAVKDLSGIGLFAREDFLDSKVKRVPYAYPLYDLDYRDNLQVLIQFLKKIKNLTSTGRQGLFRYGNMDHSVAMGARVARSMTTGSGPSHAQVAADANESFD